ncbi:hypothetical protein N0V82_001560 [Gnomoniopsis sp. IMI 355080]|nr:hypothetical protein N0V82_001560 [Gnomoniopsis sp. IMI 355080]
MMAGSSISFGLALLLVTSTSALRVTQDSSCSSMCGNTSKTNASDIVCNDFDYYASATGSTFMDCLECLQTSNATSEAENDASWFLYNLRYASAVCLYDFPAHDANASETSACDLNYACKPLQGAIESGNLNPANETEYGYCQADNNAFYGTSINDCVSCLQSSASTYTANFLLALQAGCKQEPGPGTLLSITGSLFSTTAINITSPSNTTSTVSSAASSKPSPATTIAIGVSLGILVLAAIALFTFYCIRQRRYAREDAHLLNNPYASQRPQQHHGYLYYGKEPSSSSSGAPSAFASGGAYAMQAAPPQYTVDYKTTDDFNSNAEYYDRLEGRSRGPPLQAHPVRLGACSPDSSVSATGSQAAALPTHPAYIPRSMTPGALGGRASRATSVSRSGSVSSEQQQQPRRTDQVRKKPSYAMEVYLDARDDAPVERAPSRNINLQLGGSGQGSVDDPEQVTLALQPPPRALKDRGRTSRSPPPPPGDRSMTSTPVPKSRLTAKKPLRLQIEESAPLDRNMGISGPLAFVDSRFSVRALGNDRIVEQTVDRSGRGGSNIVEVPIASGKSYLYG